MGSKTVQTKTKTGSNWSICLLVFQEMLGELFTPVETPEAPNRGFFKGLFGGGAQSLDREELCTINPRVRTQRSTSVRLVLISLRLSSMIQLVR